MLCYTKLKTSRLYSVEKQTYHANHWTEKKEVQWIKIVLTFDLQIYRRIVNITVSIYTSKAYNTQSGKITLKKKKIIWFENNASQNQTKRL